MSTIQHLFNKTLMVRRVSGTTGGKKAYSTVTVELPCHLQKETRNSAIDRYGVDGAEYTAWCDISSNIKRDDQVIGTDGNIYYVTAVIKQGDSTAMNEHIELILRKHNAN